MLDTVGIPHKILNGFQKKTYHWTTSHSMLNSLGFRVWLIKKNPKILCWMPSRFHTKCDPDPSRNIIKIAQSKQTDNDTTCANFSWMSVGSSSNFNMLDPKSRTLPFKAERLKHRVKRVSDFELDPIRIQHDLPPPSQWAVLFCFTAFHHSCKDKIPFGFKLGYWNIFKGIFRRSQG